MRRHLLVIALLVLAPLLGGSAPTVAQYATPESATPEGATPVAPPADLIAAYDAALNAHDAAAVAALYTEDATVTQAIQNGIVLHGREAIQGWVENDLAGIPDLTVTTDAVVREGDHIAWAWTYQGKYSGQFPGLPAGQGQYITLHGASFFALKDGLIASETLYYDNYAFLTQTGALATPAIG